jgi:hypothetical protein
MHNRAATRRAFFKQTVRRVVWRNSQSVREILLEAIIA